MSQGRSYFIDWFPNKPVELRPERRYRIGRGGGNEFCLPDVHASREHADIEWKGDSFVLTDLGSSNGTFLNDQPLAGSVVLKDGDEIRIGTHVLRLRVVRTDEAGKVPEEYEKTKRKVQEWQTVVGLQPAEHGGLSGAIEDVSLPQVIQMLEAGRKTGRLLTTATGMSGSVYFKEGRVVAAEYLTAEDQDSSVEGAEAVYRLLELREGVFEFLAEAVEFEPSIRESPQALLLEGLRRLDEKNLDEKGGDEKGGRQAEGGEPGPEDTQKL